MADVGGHSTLRDADARLLCDRMVALSERLTDAQLENLARALVRELRGRGLPGPTRLDLRL